MKPALLALLLGLAPFPAPAQDGAWQAEKCDRYRRTVAEVSARLGPAGIGEAFRSRNEAFIAGGCTGRADVCPRSPEELAFANAVTMLGMGRVLSSTFFPFACR